jgi:repressor LexA
MLTQRQHELLFFIHERLKQTGISPSFEEMKRGMRLKSKSGIHRLIAALEDRGFLARRQDRARALEVLRLPQNLADENLFKGAAKTVSAGSGRHPVPIGFLGSVVSPWPANDTGVIQVRIHGQIAGDLAGEAPHVSGDYVAVPAALPPDGFHQHFALQVVGDSMTGAGILEGDMEIFVVMRRFRGVAQRH